jgi:anti-sigma B factor antagonist
LRTAVARGDGGPEIAVSGDLDVSTADHLWDVLGGLVDGGDTVVLDLTELEFMDSSGLSTIIRAVKASRKGGGDVIVRSPTRAVYRLLQISAVDQILTIESPPELRPPAGL